MGVTFTALIQFPQNIDFKTLYQDIKNKDKFIYLNLLNDFETKERETNREINVFMEKYIQISYGIIDLTFNKDMVCCVRANRYWDHFLIHVETRDTLKKICIEFAKYFREEKIVYLPDHFGLDYVFSDMDLNNILKLLDMNPESFDDEKNYENLKSIWEEICKRKIRESYNEYMERTEGMRNNK